MARLLNRDYDLAATPPRLRPARPPAPGEDAVAEFWRKAADQWVRARGLEDAPGFRFLNLGILAYIGGGEAVSQLQVGDETLLSAAGSAAFLLWRSVYLVKQVAARNRILVRAQETRRREGVAGRGGALGETGVARPRGLRRAHGAHLRPRAMAFCAPPPGSWPLCSVRASPVPPAPLRIPTHRRFSPMCRCLRTCPSPGALRGGWCGAGDL